MKYGLPILMFFLIISCSPEGDFESIEEVEMFYEAANDYYKAKRKSKEFSDIFKSYNKAIAKFEKIRYVTAPGRKFANEELYGKAAKKELDCYEEKGEPDNELKLAQEWLNTYPNKSSYYALAKIYKYNIGKERAIQLYQEGISNGINLYGYLAEVYEEIGNMGLAIENYKKAIDNGAVLYFEKLSDLYLKNGNVYEAIATLKKALRVNPKMSESYLNKELNIYKKNNQYYESISTLNELLKINPKEGKYHSLLISVYVSNNDLYSAERAVERAQNIVPGFNAEVELNRIYSGYIKKNFNTNDLLIYSRSDLTAREREIWGSKMKIENKSSFKLKDIEIKINYKNLLNIFSYTLRELSSYDYSEIDYSNFSKSNGERFNIDNWTIKDIEVNFNIVYRSVEFPQTLVWSF